jgi:hypothetical protein
MDHHVFKVPSEISFRFWCLCSDPDIATEGGYPVTHLQEEIDLQSLFLSSGASNQVSDLANSFSSSSIKNSSMSLSFLTDEPRTTACCAVTHAMKFDIPLQTELSTYTSQA